MKHASRLDLTAFEDPVFYDKLERARRQTSGRIGIATPALNLCQDAVSLISLSGALAVFSPWLMLLLVLGVRQGRVAAARGEGQRGERRNRGRRQTSVHHGTSS